MEIKDKKIQHTQRTGSNIIVEKNGKMLETSIFSFCYGVFDQLPWI